MKLKKIISTVLVFVLMLVSLSFGFTAFAATSSGGCGDGVQWSYNSSTCEITISGNGKMKSYSDENVIPWETYKTSIKTVIIKSGVTSVGNRSFNNCVAITKVTLADSVKTVGDYAFENCSALKAVTFGKGVTLIGGYAFKGCKAIETITMPSSLTSIGNFSFAECYGLKSIAIPNNVKTIGDSAFSYCGKLKSVSFGKGLSSIGVSAFTNTALTGVDIPGNVKTIKNYAFSEIFNLTEAKLHEGTISIGGGAFQYTSLTKITIPSSVTSIGDKAVGYDMSGGKVNGFLITCRKGTAGYDYALKGGFEIKLTIASVGDVHFDGKVNSSDALMILKSVKGALKLTSEQKKVADVNKNNTVYFDDASLILDFATNKIKAF